MIEMAGRPLIFKTNEELKEAVNKYFDYCSENKRPETIAGLAYYLDVDRTTIYNYENRDEFFHTIKRARDRILAGLEEALFIEGKSGQIFLAKNYGYSDNRGVTLTGKDGGPISIKPDLSKLSVEELEELERIIGRASPDAE